MCCFAGPVTSVTNTRIFGRLSGQGTQYLAYQMRFQSPNLNAMILPLPVEQAADEQSLKFLDLSDYDNFFADLQRGFPAPQPTGLLLSRQITSGAIASPMLKVQEVGSYVASFVPSQRDFARLDPQFVIPSEVWAKIPAYHDYGFAVFQLKELAGQPHPMAFEFRTRTWDDVFFPTVHIHDGQVHEQEAFDHTLYMQHTAFDAASGPKYSAKPEPQTGWTRSNGLASSFTQGARAQGLVDGDRLVHRRLMRGSFANRDLLISTRVEPLQSLLLPWRIMAPIAALLPVAWIIRRRKKLARVRSEE